MGVGGATAACEFERFQTPRSRPKKHLNLFSDCQFSALYVILLRLELCGTQPTETAIAGGRLSQENMAVCLLSQP